VPEMSNGYIKLWRKFREWGWYKDSHTVHLFLHLLLCANHKPITFKGTFINTGECMVGRKQLSVDTGISEQSIRTSLERLKSTNEITIKTTNKFSIITIINWATYQSREDDTNQQTNHQSNQQLTNNQPTTNHKQECKEVKNVKNKYKIYGEYGHVKLSDDQYEKLKIKLGDSLNEWIKKADEYVEQKGKRYNNYYLTILNWYNKDKNNLSKNDKYLKLME
jgi:hypothetical protein